MILVSFMTSMFTPDLKMYNKIAKGFTQLDDWLDSNTESDAPAENLATAVKYFNRTRSSLHKPNINDDIILALGVVAELARLQVCNDRALELISIVRNTTQAYASNPVRSINKLVRPFVLAAVEKCEPEHDKRFHQALNSMNETNKRRLFDLIDDEFIQRHYKVHQVPLHFRYHSLMQDYCCAPDLHELVQLLGKTIMGKNKPNTDCSLEDVYDKYLGNACRPYIEHMNDVFEQANDASYFDLGKDFAFIQRRSAEFQTGVFRFQLCKEIVNKRHVHIGKLSKLIDLSQ